MATTRVATTIHESGQQPSYSSGDPRGRHVACGCDVFSTGIALNWQRPIKRPFHERAVEVSNDFSGIQFMEQREDAGTHTDFAVSDTAFSVAYCWRETLQVGAFCDEGSFLVKEVGVGQVQGARQPAQAWLVVVTLTGKFCF